MTRVFAFLLCSAVCACSAAAAEHQPRIGERVEDFRLQDFRGATHALSDLADQRAVVLAFVGVECPVAKLHTPRLIALAADYAERGVAFVGVSSNQQDSVTELAAFARDNGVTFPILKDLGNRLADAVGASRTPEVFVLDAERVIRYAGRIDDHYLVGTQRKESTSNDLARALDEVLNGQSVTEPLTRSVGCLIGRVRQPKADASVTYSDQIARIFQNRCVECHRSGEIAPFALTNYDEAVGWAEMIDEVVSQRRMPPWHADERHGRFANDRRMSDEEMALIHQWVLDGAPQGDTAKLPQPRKFVEGWQLPRLPDQTFHMSEAAYEIPSEGEVAYQYFTVDPGFTEDKWVKAAQVLPGNRAVVHHIIVFVQPPEGEGPPQPASLGGRQHFTSYVPGRVPTPYEAGFARKIPAGSKLVFQVHYTPIGTPQTDRSIVGFVYEEASNVREQVVTHVAPNAGFVIPPQAPNHRVESDSPSYSKDVLLLSLSPHMHFRGKAFRYEAVYPDGRTETLLDVPRYDFNWQTRYELSEPKMLPAGTHLHCVAHFDNSEDNLANPDPSKEVRWGDQTWEEMMLGYYEIAFAGDAPNIAEATGSQGSSGAAGGFAALLTDPQAIVTKYDADGSGALSQNEMPMMLRSAFGRIDTNGDGACDADELRAAFERLRRGAARN